MVRPSFTDSMTDVISQRIRAASQAEHLLHRLSAPSAQEQESLEVLATGSSKCQKASASQAQHLLHRLGT